MKKQKKNGSVKLLSCLLNSCSFCLFCDDRKSLLHKLNAVTAKVNKKANE